MLLWIDCNLNAQQPVDYYNGISGKDGALLRSALSAIISGHQEYSYDVIWDILKESDEDPSNSNNVILVYSGRSRNKDYVDRGGAFDYGAAGYSHDDSWNREHVWAQSHGSFGYTIGEGTDAHNLKPVDYNVNASRSNKDFDNGGSPAPEGADCYIDSDSWEPRDDAKGDVARIIFYMATRYEGVSGELDLQAKDAVNNSPNPWHGKLSTLLTWNSNDPPDDFERHRNNVIYSWQGNRNPFIDYPDLANLIWNGKSASDIQFSNALQTPQKPSSAEGIDVSVDVISIAGNITGATLSYGYDYNNLANDIAMTPTGNNYAAQIPAQEDGKQVYYRIKANDDNGIVDSLRADFTVKSSLEPGDIAVIGYNTSTWGDPDCQNNQDNFAFVPLVNIEGGTEIYFTDNGVRANGCLRTNEGIIKWTAPVGGVTKGTIISLYSKDDATCQPAIISGPGTIEHESSGTSFDMNISGEQIIIFQDDGNGLQCPDKYLFAITNNESWQSDATDSHTSILPPGLTDGVNALALPKDGVDFQNNARFDCSMAEAGTKEEILESLVNPNNWEGSESTIYELPNCTFQFGGCTIEYITYDQIKLSWSEPNPTDELIILAKEDGLVTANPSGDGTSYSADAAFSNGTNIGDNTFIVFKGDTNGPEEMIVTGLTEDKDYYFKTYTHIAPSGTNWEEGGTSSPESVTAKVQDVENEVIRLNDSNDVQVNWINYFGIPKSEWWDGGVMILHRTGSPVQVTRNDLNEKNQSTDSYTKGDDLSPWGGNFAGTAVIYTNNTSSTNTTITGLERGVMHYFKIYHNDGLIKVDDYWSNGRALSINIPAPEIFVEGNANEIANLDFTPALIDHTDFGAIVANTTYNRTFYIKNTGDGTLNITGSPEISMAIGTYFSVVVYPATQINAVNGQTEFSIRFEPGGATGSFTDTVIIQNDDPDEAPYKFAIKGTSESGCFIATPQTGTVGTSVTLKGEGFSGVTAVKFNETNAEFTVVSDNEITTIVPSGATTGDITATPGALTNSCDPFTVISAPGTCY